jgi:hypothetical protein
VAASMAVDMAALTNDAAIASSSESDIGVVS